MFTIKEICLLKCVKKKNSKMTCKKRTKQQLGWSIIQVVRKYNMFRFKYYLPVIEQQR